MHLKLISTELSPCCAAEAQIVVSRAGGLISRGCLKCGTSHYVNESQIPKIECPKCNIKTCIRKLDGSNYFFECQKCGWNEKIADIVPHWSDVFSYDGLAAHGDLYFLE